MATEELTDTTGWTLREQTAGLMRGSREKLQLGYTARNAAYAALRSERGFSTDVAIDDPVLTEDLFPYAEGFEDGMADALEAWDPNTRYKRHHDAALSVEEWSDLYYPDGAAYRDGLRDGRREFAPSLYPALERGPDRDDYIQRFPERV